MTEDRLPQRWSAWLESADRPASLEAALLITRCGTRSFPTTVEPLETLQMKNALVRRRLLDLAAICALACWRVTCWLHQSLDQPERSGDPPKVRRGDPGCSKGRKTTCRRRKGRRREAVDGVNAVAQGVKGWGKQQQTRRNQRPWSTSTMRRPSASPCCPESASARPTTS